MGTPAEPAEGARAPASREPRGRSVWAGAWARAMYAMYAMYAGTPQRHWMVPEFPRHLTDGFSVKQAGSFTAPDQAMPPDVRRRLEEK